MCYSLGPDWGHHQYNDPQSQHHVFLDNGVEGPHFFKSTYSSCVGEDQTSQVGKTMVALEVGAAVQNSIIVNNPPK